jgi:hypothetical protein
LVFVVTACSLYSWFLEELHVRPLDCLACVAYWDCCGRDVSIYSLVGCLRRWQKMRNPLGYYRLRIIREPQCPGGAVHVTVHGPASVYGSKWPGDKGPCLSRLPAGPSVSRAESVWRDTCSAQLPSKGRQLTGASHLRCACRPATSSQLGRLVAGAKVAAPCRLPNQTIEGVPGSTGNRAPLVRL